MIQVPVRDGISKAQELVEKANNGDGEIYHHEEKKEKQNIIRLFYKHLMNGISHALPFLVTSRVLYGILYLFKDQVLTNQLLILTSNVQQLISIIIIPIISAYIADSIADRPGMLSGFAGGLIVCQGISITSISTSSPSLLAGIIAGFSRICIFDVKKVIFLFTTMFKRNRSILVSSNYFYNYCYFINVLFK